MKEELLKLEPGETFVKSTGLGHSAIHITKVGSCFVVWYTQIFNTIKAYGGTFSEDQIDNVVDLIKNNNKMVH